MSRGASALAAVSVAVLALWGSTSLAAPSARTPEQVQLLGELAYDMGRLHALHRLCVGPSDDLWRGRMEKMMAAESAAPDLRRRLSDRFNAGYVSAGVAFSTCGPQSSEEERQTAAEGRVLALKLGAASP